LEHGCLKDMGPTSRLVSDYLRTFHSDASSVDLTSTSNHSGTGEIRIMEASLLNNDGEPCSTVNCGTNLAFELILNRRLPSRPLFACVEVRTTMGTPVLHIVSTDDPTCSTFEFDERMIIRCCLHDCRLYPGTYVA